MSSLPKTCADCGAALGPRNTSGYCARHVGTANMRRPGVREKAAQRMRLRLKHDPALRDTFIANIRKAQKSPKADAARRARWKSGEMWNVGNAAQPKGSEARKRMAATLSATRLAWCPPHLRDQYRELTNRKGMRAAEARTLILEQHEAEMRRWRRSVGAEPPPPLPVLGGTFLDRASEVAARWAEVATLWCNGRGGKLSRARWAVFLALRRGGWTPNRIASETGMDRKSVEYGLRKAEVLAAAPGEFSALFARVVGA